MTKAIRRLLDAFVMAFHFIFCNFFGFDWLGQGWTSSTFEPLPDGMTFKHFWACSRCGLIRYSYETQEAMKLRYDGYERKHGNNSLVVDDTFAPPKP